MSDLYFTKFPNILYNGVLCRDITRNVQLSETTRNQATIFYPYTVQSGVRADVISDAYYEDSYREWLIYLTNGIIDSYYGWYLDETAFQTFIKQKYGSMENAQLRVKEYRLNSTNDDIDVTPQFYNNNLPFVLKKYYTPNYGFGSKVISYRRRQDSWSTNTNRIVQFNVTYNSNTMFQTDELLTINHSLLPVGNGQVIFANTSTVIIKNISGNTSSNNVLTGRDSLASANVTLTSVLQETITDEEFVYWGHVTYFDYENEKNEANKNIRLLDSNYALQVSEGIRKKMKEA